MMNKRMEHYAQMESQGCWLLDGNYQVSKPTGNRGAIPQMAGRLIHPPSRNTEAFLPLHIFID